eukprot:CCRYP_020103-RA/>CCRYP_020103-RA protein AED:0.07 eAED:0.07 QI:155/1/1/1/0.4/0.33/6/2341/186
MHQNLGAMIKSKKTLPVEFGIINADNVEQLKKINQACLPIAYAPSFYQELVSKNPKDGASMELRQNLSKFAYWNGFAVGAICSKVEAIKDCPGRSRIYIMTLATLAPYRNRGIGSALLDSLISYYESHATDTALSTVDEIMLHVQTSNEDAIKFYEQFGFEREEFVEGYYKRIDPPDCFVLRKKLR